MDIEEDGLHLSEVDDDDDMMDAQSTGSMLSDTLTSHTYGTDAAVMENASNTTSKSSPIDKVCPMTVVMADTLRRITSPSLCVDKKAPLIKEDCPIGNTMVDTSNIKSIPVSAGGSISTSCFSASPKVPFSTSSVENFRPVLSKSQRRRRQKLIRNKLAQVSILDPDTVKRVRGSNSSANDSPPTAKKVKSSTSTHIPPTTPKTEVVIFNNSSIDGKISGSEMQAIRSALNLALDSLDLASPLPRFNKFFIGSSGHLFVDCEDKASLTWLTAAVGELKVWDNCSLKVINKDELPKPIKALLIIPGDPDDPKLVLNRLSRHNPGLQTKEWRTLAPTFKSNPPNQATQQGSTQSHPEFRLSSILGCW